MDMALSLPNKNKTSGRLNELQQIIKQTLVTTATNNGNSGNEGNIRKKCIVDTLKYLQPMTLRKIIITKQVIICNLLSFLFCVRYPPRCLKATFGPVFSNWVIIFPFYRIKLSLKKKSNDVAKHSQIVIGQVSRCNSCVLNFINS